MAESPWGSTFDVLPPTTTVSASPERAIRVPGPTLTSTAYWYPVRTGTDTFVEVRAGPLQRRVPVSAGGDRVPLGAQQRALGEKLQPTALLRGKDRGDANLVALLASKSEGVPLPPDRRDGLLAIGSLQGDTLRGLGLRHHLRLRVVRPCVCRRRREHSSTHGESRDTHRSQPQSPDRTWRALTVQALTSSVEGHGSPGCGVCLPGSCSRLVLTGRGRRLDRTCGCTRSAPSTSPCRT